MPAVRWKYLFVLIDGLADVASAPDHRTCLQRAHTVALDALARCGVTGLVDPVHVGLACGSDTAHLSLFGVDPLRYYRGRGAFESMGAGLEMRDGDVAFKANFAVIDTDAQDGTTAAGTSGGGDQSMPLVRARRADRAFHAWGKPLCAHLDGLPLPRHPGVSVSVQYATEHRCGVRLRGANLSDAITGTDPLKDNLPLLVCRPVDGHSDEDTLYTSQVVNELSGEFHRVLAAHPINVERRAHGEPYTNVVLLRGAGARVPVPSLQQRYQLRGFAICPTAIIAGLTETLSMTRIPCDGATGDYETNLTNKGVKAVETLTASDCEWEYDFGFLHVKAVDDAGHDQSLSLKERWLEQCDRMIGECLAALQKAEESDNSVRYVMLVTGDHTTPARLGDHSHEPVPLVIARVHDTKGPRSQSASGCDGSQCSGCQLRALDTVAQFDEVSCSTGVLGRFRGSSLLQTAIAFAQSSHCLTHTHSRFYQ